MNSNNDVILWLIPISAVMGAIIGIFGVYLSKTHTTDPAEGFAMILGIAGGTVSIIGILSLAILTIYHFRRRKKLDDPK